MKSTAFVKLTGPQMGAATKLFRDEADGDSDELLAK